MAPSNPLEWMNDDDYAAFNATRFEREFSADPSLTQFVQNQENDALELQQHARRQVDATAASLEFQAFAEPDLEDASRVVQRDLEDSLLARTPDEMSLNERIGDASYSIPMQPAQEFGITAAGLQQPVPGATTQEVGPQAAPTVPGGEPPSPGDLLGGVGGAISAALNLGAEQSERVMGILADTGFGRGVRGVASASPVAAAQRGLAGLAGYNLPPGVSTPTREPFELEPDISAEVATAEAQLPPEIVDQLNKTIGHSFFANQQAKLDAFRDTKELLDEIQAWEISEFHDPSVVGEWNENIDPNWAGNTMQDIADVRAARFQSKLNDITDKYGIAWAEIVGNIALDPLNLVGFGLLSKVPVAGKALGAAERLYVKAVSKPFEIAGKGIVKTVGLGLGTRIDQAVAKAGSQTENYFTSKGLLLTDDVNATDELVRLATGRAGAKLPAEFADIQQVFDADVHNALPELLKGLTPAEAVERIAEYHRVNVQALVEASGLDPSVLQEVAGQDVIQGLLEQQGVIRQVLKAVPTPSWMQKPFGKVGSGARMINDNAIDPIHRAVNLPLARAQLLFAAYAPFNYLETLAFSMLSGAKPGLVSADVYDLLRQVDDVIPAIGGKRAPAVGFSRQTEIANRGDPVSRFFQGLYENMDGAIDGGLRRNTAVQHIEQGIAADAVLREAAEKIRQDIYDMLPESLRHEAHNLAQAAAIWGLRRPKSLPQLADQFLLPQIKQRAAMSVAMEYTDLPPEALQAVVDYTSGKIRTVDGLRTKVDEVLNGRVADKAIADIDVLADMVVHLDGMADRAATEGGAYLTDFLTAHRFVRIQLDQAHRRLQGTTNQLADIARQNRDWQQLDKLWRVEAPANQQRIQAAQDHFQELWNKLVQKDPSIANHALANNQIDGEIYQIIKRYERLDLQNLEPVREAAGLTKGRIERSRAWDNYFRLRREHWAKRDKEIDALIQRDYPEFGAVMSGTTAAPPGLAPLQAKFGQVSEEMRRRANNLIADIEGLNSLKAAPEDVQRLRQGLQDMAEVLPEDHADRMAAVITEAAQRTQETFINYPGNSLDAVARVADPFWIYQSRRLARIAEQGVRHPGMLRLYEDYFSNTERGYVTSDATGRYQIDLTRGSILSLIAAGRRRGNVIDLEAMSRGEVHNVLRGDRFPERYDGFFGQVEKAQELLSGLGIYPGGAIELAISLLRAFGLEKDSKATFTEAAELGNLIPPPVSLAVNALEIAGVDTTGFHEVLRDPFHDRALKLAQVEIKQRRQTEGLPELRQDELEREARKQAAIDEAIGTQIGALRVRSPEEIKRNEVSDKVMADRRGVTPREYRAQRLSPDHVPPDALDRMEVNAAWGRMLNGTPIDGAELRQMISSANQELRPLELRQLAEKIEEKRTQLIGLRQEWQPRFDKAMTDLQSVGFIREFNIAGDSMTSPTLSDVYGTYWKQWQKIEQHFADELPQSSAEWDQVAAQYGTEAPDRGPLDQALRLFRDITPDNDEFQLPLGETDWNSYFQAREDFLSNLPPGVRSQIEALTMQRDMQSDLPFRQEMRLAGRLRRQMYEQPKYFYFQASLDTRTRTPQVVHAQEYTVWSPEIQNKMQAVENLELQWRDGRDFQAIAAQQTFDLTQPWLATGRNGPRPEVSATDVVRQELRARMTSGNPGDNPFQGRRPDGEPTAVIANLEELNQIFAHLDEYATAKRIAGEITESFKRQESPRQQYLTEVNREYKFPGSDTGLLDVVYGGKPIHQFVLQQ